MRGKYIRCKYIRGKYIRGKSNLINDKTFMVALICLNLLPAYVMAAPNYTYESTTTQPVYNSGYVQKPLQGSAIMAPAGVYMNTRLLDSLSSAYSSVGQSVNLILNDDFYHEGRLIAPEGSTICGVVIESSPAKRGGINGRLSVRFNRICTPYGTQIPISAVIRTFDSTGVLVGGSKIDVAKEYAKDVAAGSAAGAVSGVVFGALAGGDVGRGAALGTAVGAGSGLIKSVLDKGSDVELPANSAFDIILTQPVTIERSSAYYEN